MHASLCKCQGKSRPGLGRGSLLPARRMADRQTAGRCVTCLTTTTWTWACARRSRLLCVAHRRGGLFALHSSRWIPGSGCGQIWFSFNFFFFFFSLHIKCRPIAYRDRTAPRATRAELGWYTHVDGKIQFGMDTDPFQSSDPCLVFCCRLAETTSTSLHVSRF